MRVINRPLLKYYGGKWRLWPWHSQFITRHERWVSPFGGGASEFFRRARSAQEYYNDLDRQVVKLFRVLREPEQLEKLKRMLRYTPWSRLEWELAQEDCADPVESARRTLVRYWMSYGSGTLGYRTGFNRVTKSERGIDKAQRWARDCSSIDPYAERMMGVVIECSDAFVLMDELDGPETFFYVDPPYLHGVRGMTNKKHGYAVEMTDADHLALCDKLLELKGDVLLCGYDNDIYRMHLQAQGWIVRRHKARIASAAERTECVWLAPGTARKLGVG